MIKPIKIYQSIGLRAEEFEDKLLDILEMTSPTACSLHLR